MGSTVYDIVTPRYAATGCGCGAFMFINSNQGHSILPVYVLGLFVCCYLPCIPVLCIQAVSNVPGHGQVVNDHAHGIGYN